MPRQNVDRIFADIEARILKGDHFRHALKVRAKMPKRFSGKTGVLFKPEWQDID